ncbi:DUF3500 domain-containing protein [Pantoea sp. LMR881]|uniref:DUF3500 domain-containing protein n=1 Tax=Pantoea sp. LMR881 TaxID=3014336 RepID=UPI0022AE8597|nr:DUF3500 domain-containing protein [Pantoea sp. LMR881]MCZ4061636.1 DUF3500 domain-containing protein [Pantoea sp. LMR881]
MANASERFNFADQRHLAGAFQDNRVIPLEGICAAEFDAPQRARLMQTIAAFRFYLTGRAARLKQIEQHLESTWWSWIGGCGEDDVFYYRIQSPVVLRNLIITAACGSPTKNRALPYSYHYPHSER